MPRRSAPISSSAPTRTRRCRYRSELQVRPKEIVMNENTARRRLLGWLAGSPLLAAAASTGSLATLLAVASRNAHAQSYDALRGANVVTGVDGIIAAPHEAINVFEFEPAAKKALFAQGAPTHWGYLESGV